jgi:hypothetical protein
MRYVILRDDDTNAFTPASYIDQLYRPFVSRGLPVNLAVIPYIRSDLKTLDGRIEGFVKTRQSSDLTSAPIGHNHELVDLLRNTPGYHIVQHGCYHDPWEFDRRNRRDVVYRLNHGTELLVNAGFPFPRTFVAPHDKLSRISYKEVSARFRVISTGWFELRRLPFTWWPQFIWKKIRGVPHWECRNTILLSHPGCLLSYTHPLDSMLSNIKQAIEKQTLTVLVTHWWEYFRDGKPDEAFIKVLHQTADYLRSNEDIRVVSFDQLARGEVPLN